MRTAAEIVAIIAILFYLCVGGKEDRDDRDDLWGDADDYPDGEEESNGPKT